MFRVPLPARDTTLLLSPRWGDFSSPWQFGLYLLVALLPILLVLWLYRHELRLVRRWVAWGLLFLRLAVLLLILILVGLQPIVARSTTEELPGRLLIAVDRSESMEVADPQRPIVDKLRLARALKVANDICQAAELDDWIRQYDEKGGVEWVRADEFPNDPARRREVADQRRRLHDQVCQRVDQMTRSQMAQRIWSPDGLGFLRTASARHQIELLGFAQDIWEVEASQLDKLYESPLSAAEPARGDDRPAVQGSAAFTDLHLPMARALERSGPDRGKILGLVLLTDGRHNSGPSPVTKALEMGEHHVPVYPIALGARQAPPDISLVSVQAPSAVFKDVDVQLEARVKVSGLPAQDVVVELQRPGQPPQEERFHHDGADRYHTVRFQTCLEKAGTQAVTVAVKSVPGEIRTDNNSRTRVINVADDRAKVLLIDGEARWEYHYLANALLRDRALQVERVVFNQPRLEKISEEELEKAGNPRLTLSTDPDALAAYDCIILGDVDPAQLPGADRHRLEKYVADRGGTLVILAGKRFMPLAYVNAGKTGENDDNPLFKLLPIVEPMAVNPASGFPVTLSHEGKSTAFMQLEQSTSENESRWANLPLHFWGVVGRAKPGAAPLAFAADPEAPKDQRERGVQEKERALIVRQSYGFGRVLFVGLESTWRWRYKTGDLYHHRFWGQVVRWAASDKPLVAGNEHIRFGTREAVYRQGQEIEIVARLNEEAGRLRPEALAGARIIREGNKAAEEAVALVPLLRRAAQPGVLEGRIRDLPAGQYAVELAIPELTDKLQGPPGADGNPTRLRASFSITPPEGEELVELATNWPLLEEVAAKSGGQVFTPENALDLVDLLERQVLVREHYSEQRLWQWWLSLVILLLLLTFEWIGRKWAGLP